MYCCKRALKLSYPSEFKLVLIRYDVFGLMTYLFVLYIYIYIFLGKLNNYSNSIRCLTVSFESRMLMTYKLNNLEVRH